MITGKKLLEFYILWTINKAPKCGYDIMKELEDFFIMKRMSQAIVYVTLRGMESKKYLKGTKGSRNKTIYNLTNLGEKRLMEEKGFMRMYVLKFWDIIEDVLENTNGDDTIGQST